MSTAWNAQVAAQAKSHLEYPEVKQNPMNADLYLTAALARIAELEKAAKPAASWLLDQPIPSPGRTLGEKLFDALLASPTRGEGEAK